MGLFLTTCAGLVIWIILWALGVKSFDAFMVMGFIVVLAAGWYVVRPHVQSFLGRGQQPG